MDVPKMGLGDIAKHASYYFWLTSGVMLLGMFEAFYRDSMHALPELDLALGGCLRLETGDLEDFTVAGEAELIYTDSNYLPSSATLSITSSDVLRDLSPNVFFDGSCIGEVTYPIAEAIKYSFIVSVLLSATVLSVEILLQKNTLAKLFSTYIWLLAGSLSVGVFDAFYRDTLHQLPELDLSMGGCIEAGPGNFPDSLEPGVVELSYDTDHYPPQSASFQINPVKEFSNYQPTFLFKSECVAKITKPFGRALEVGFFVGLSFCAVIFLLEQWTKRQGWPLKCQREHEESQEQSKSTSPHAHEKVRTDSDELELIRDIETGDGQDDVFCPIGQSATL